jgi:uncharacterized protein YodC (DUF2158 family)
MSLKKGDVVRLKSGGPKMVISDLDAYGSAYCQWFDGAKDAGKTFAVETLEPAP